jgi:hypothetical protein
LQRTDLGPCAKRQVRCTIVCPDGRQYTGENLCRNPQATCPRAEGEDYTKCHTICGTVGHAETVAIDAMLEDGNDGGIAYLEGHWRACGSCRSALEWAFITDIRLGAPT